MSEFFEIIDSTLYSDDERKVHELRERLIQDRDGYLQQKTLADAIWREADDFLKPGSSTHEELTVLTTEIESTLSELNTALNHFERQQQRRLVKKLREEINAGDPIAPSFRRDYLINKVVKANNDSAILYVIESLKGTLAELQRDYASVEKLMIGFQSVDREHFEAILDNADDVMDALINDIKYLENFLVSR